MTRDTITIVAGADDAFALPMGVTLYSALANLERGRSVSLYVMDGGISERNRQKLLEVLNVEHVKTQIKWLRPDLRRLEGLSVATWLTPATYLRLFIPELLPTECDRALYLDCDLLVESDVGPLWERDLSDVRACGVLNYFSPIVSWKKEGAQISRDFGLVPETPFCNAGVLLMNLNRWREEQLGLKALKFARECSLPESDQDAINIVVAGQWGVLDAKWNVQLSGIERYGSFLKTSLHLSDLEVEQTCTDLLRNPGILHFTWLSKPWRFAYRGPSRTRFFHYLKESQWFGDVRDDSELAALTFREQPEAEPWLEKVKVAKRELDPLIPLGDRFILVDQATWDAGSLAGWRTIPFPERDGQYWGLPSDDASAIREFERLQNTGAHFMVFAWPAFWWLEQYPQLHAHLREHFACILKNERLIVFDLRSRLEAQQAIGAWSYSSCLHSWPFAHIVRQLAHTTHPLRACLLTVPCAFGFALISHSSIRATIMRRTTTAAQMRSVVAPSGPNRAAVRGAKALFAMGMTLILLSVKRSWMFLESIGG